MAEAERKATDLAAEYGQALTMVEDDLLANRQAPRAALWRDGRTPSADHSSAFTPHHRFELLPVGASKEALLTTGWQ